MAPSANNRIGRTIPMRNAECRVMRRRSGRTSTAVTAAAALAATTLAGCGIGDGTAAAREKAAADGARAGAECSAVQAPGDTKARQLRGMWIATVANIDWPSTTGLPVERQKAEY